LSACANAAYRIRDICHLVPIARAILIEVGVIGGHSRRFDIGPEKRRSV
jgi:hypothetical protein